MATPTSIAEQRIRFSEQFEALTGSQPYPWQEGLFELFIQGVFPPDINLPTGSGKTSIIALWLLAVSHQAQHLDTVNIPRRLVWVVDRRVVVDQATEESEQIRKRLADKTATAVLNSVRDGLRKLSHDPEQSELVAISTLRGEKEDNREWSHDPARPAIIVGTVDMIGSRLLFSGYGDSRYWRAQHAGLLGHDTLLVNDEAHLTPAFAKLISAIESAQDKKLKPFRTIRLSATHSEKKCWPESLEADRRHHHFKKIYESKKVLHIQTHPAAKLESILIDLAAQKGSGRTILFVTEPDKAQRFAASIKKKLGANYDKRVLTLTGTMRGYERDQLVKKDEFKMFAAAVRPHDDYWLIATSAGEVGVNISADRLITTLDTLDHLLQRFGRLNRFGESEGVAYLLCSDKEKHERKLAALDFLRTHLSGTEDDYNISPQALFGLSLTENACTERPLIAPLHPWHIDVWSQTSIGAHPSRPEVAPWLHGKQENLPETFVAWRQDVGIVEGPSGSLIASDEREEILEKYPLLAHEQLREPTNKLIRKLATLFSTTERKARVWRRKRDGTSDVIELPKMRSAGRTDSYIDIRNDEDKGAFERELAYCQLVFRPECGKPTDGMFDPVWVAVPESGPAESKEPKNGVSVPYDVSGAQTRSTENGPPVETRGAFLATQQEGNEWLLERLGVAPREPYSPEALDEFNLSELNRFAERHRWRFLLQVRLGRDDEDSGPKRRLVYFGPESKRVQKTKQILTLAQHNADVGKKAADIATSLNLPSEIVLALETAGKLHDLGKQEDIWQKAAGNWDWEKGSTKHAPVAKPVEVMRGRQLGGFRHELASMRWAKEEPSLAGLDPEIRELILHLIAAHHGHGRSCFESKAYDRTRLAKSEELAQESIERFSRLQQKYRAWGLAYLESLLRAADAIASQIGLEQPPNA